MCRPRGPRCYRSRLTRFRLWLFSPESTLSSFRQSDESWDDAKHMLSHFTDPHLQYFALSVYEDWIATRWKLVPDSRKAELLSFLMDMAIQSGKVRFLTPFAVRMQFDARTPLFSPCKLTRPLLPSIVAELAVSCIYVFTEDLGSHWTSGLAEASTRIHVARVGTCVFP